MLRLHSRLAALILVFLVPVAAQHAQAAGGGSDPIYRVAGLASFRDADFSRMTEAVVPRVVAGDTVAVTVKNPPVGLFARERVRLVGVDTPETVHPSKPVQFFGKEASAFTKAALSKKTVRLAFDRTLRDRYGRLLAYIYTEKGRCFNAELVEKGYGHAYTVFPFQFLEEFRALQKKAREKKAGLWGAP